MNLMRKPNGQVVEVHPDDVQKAIAAGYRMEATGAQVDSLRSVADEAGREVAAAPGNLARAGMNLLPAVGSGFGGALGGAGGSVFGLGFGGVPGALAGAALGGAGGEAARQNIARLIPGLGIQPPNTPGEAAGRMATEAGAGVAAEGGGLLLQRGFRAGARSMMGKALRVPAKQAEAWRTMRGKARPEIAPEVPADVIDSALEEKVILGGAPNYRGTTQTEALRGQSAAEAERMLKFTQRGRSRASAPIHAGGSIMDDVWKLKAEAKHSAKDVERLNDLVADFQSTKRTPDGKSWKRMKIEDVQEIKQWAQDKAKPLYAKEAAGNLDDASSMALKFYKALASGAQRTLENEYNQVAMRTGREIGALAKANARTGRMIQLNQAVKRRELAPPGGVTPGGVLADVATLGIPRFLSQPGVQSRLALGMNEPATLAVGRQVPRGLGYLGRMLFLNEAPPAQEER